MARFAVIQGGTVSNITESDADFAQAQGWIAAPDTASIGDLWSGTAFSAPPPAPPAVPTGVPMASARVILLRHGYDDAAIRTAVANSTMTASQKAEALIDWEFRQTVRRTSALTLVIGAILGLTPAQMDGMFIEAQAL